MKKYEAVKAEHHVFSVMCGCEQLQFERDETGSAELSWELARLKVRGNMGSRIHLLECKNS